MVLLVFQGQFRRTEEAPRSGGAVRAVLRPVQAFRADPERVQMENPDTTIWDMVDCLQNGQGWLTGGLA